MEKATNEETIDSKYIILDKKGSGLTANVFKVRDKENQTLYAAKVLKKPSNYFAKEIEVLKIIKPFNNPFIVNMVDSGEGLVIRKGHPEKKSQYLILEYASKGELFDYIYYPDSGLSERHCKVVFAKILKGIQACHNMGLCHRDLKMQNILVDENFNPKIIDFGFATNNDGHLEEYLGTENYAAPEIFLNQPYDGFKADIFSLGVVLLNLTTCKIGFKNATKSDPYYIYIILKKYARYWNIVSGKIKGLSQELKNLYLKMVAYNPEERPTIQQILDDDWMKEIREMNNEQLMQLENEIREEFLKREALVEIGIKKEKEMEANNLNESSGNRNVDDDIFDLDLKPKYAQTGLNMNNYIKLKGKINPAKFMNSLVNKINKEFEGECEIEPNKEKLKFNVIFEEAQSNEEIEEELLEELKSMGIKENEEINENENIKGKKTVIQIKIYESYNEGYLVRFLRKEGETIDYLEKMKKIYSLVDKM